MAAGLASAASTNGPMEAMTSASTSVPRDVAERVAVLDPDLHARRCPGRCSPRRGGVDQRRAASGRRRRCRRPGRRAPAATPGSANGLRCRRRPRRSARSYGLTGMSSPNAVVVREGVVVVRGRRRGGPSIAASRASLRAERLVAQCRRRGPAAAAAAAAARRVLLDVGADDLEAAGLVLPGAVAARVDRVRVGASSTRRARRPASGVRPRGRQSVRGRRPSSRPAPSGGLGDGRGVVGVRVVAGTQPVPDARRAGGGSGADGCAARRRRRRRRVLPSRRPRAGRRRRAARAQRGSAGRRWSRRPTTRARRPDRSRRARGRASPEARRRCRRSTGRGPATAGAGRSEPQLGGS